MPAILKLSEVTLFRPKFKNGPNLEMPIFRPTFSQNILCLPAQSLRIQKMTTANFLVLAVT